MTEVREWMRYAADDLRCAEAALALDPPLLNPAMFHCQQCVEKALKAFLILHGQTFRRTHSLEEIGEPCIAIDRSLFDCIDRAIPLTAAAVMVRYPGEHEMIDEDDATEALALAREVYQAIAARIPQ